MQNSADPNLYYKWNQQKNEFLPCLLVNISLVANLSYTQRQWSLTHLSIVVVTSHFLLLILHNFCHWSLCHCKLLITFLPLTTIVVTDHWYPANHTHFLTLFNSCSPTPLNSVVVTDHWYSTNHTPFFDIAHCLLTRPSYLSRCHWSIYPSDQTSFLTLNHFLISQI